MENTLKKVYVYLDEHLNHLMGEDSSSKEEVEELVNLIKEIENFIK